MITSWPFYKKSIKISSQTPPPELLAAKPRKKRKNISSDLTSPTPKKPKPSHPSQAPAQQGEDRILSALLSIQGTLSDLDNRILALELQRLPSAPRVTFDRQTSSSTSECGSTSDLDANVPRRSPGSALPAPSSRVPFFPPAAAVSPQLRAQILSGNDIKLVKILLCAETNNRRIVQ